MVRDFVLLFLAGVLCLGWSETVSRRRAERITGLEKENATLRASADEHNRRMWHVVRMAKLFTGRFAFTDTRPDDDPAEDKIRQLEFAIVKAHGCPEVDSDMLLFDARFCGCERKEFVTK